MLSAYQRRIGLELGVPPGTELLEAIQVAEARGIPVELCDRDVRTTLLRAWRSMPFFQKARLVLGSAGGGLDAIELDEDELRELRRLDVITGLLDELGQAFPSLKRVLIDERDAYLAERMRRSTGRRVVAVVGAGHVPGIERALEARAPTDLEALETVPPASRTWRWVGWGIPAAILSGIAWIAVTKGVGQAGATSLYWILVNAVPSALGAALALAHPATILAAALSAPFTSLTPVIGVGYVTAFVQAWCAPPRVRELTVQTLGEEALVPRRWWTNRLLKIGLVLGFTTLGSILGTWLGAVEILSNVR